MANDDFWILDTGASYHMAENSARMYEVRTLPPSREFRSTAGKGKLGVQFVEGVIIVIQGVAKQRMKLVDES